MNQTLEVMDRGETDNTHPFGMLVRGMDPDVILAATSSSALELLDDAAAATLAHAAGLNGTTEEAIARIKAAPFLATVRWDSWSLSESAREFFFQRLLSVQASQQVLAMAFSIAQQRRDRAVQEYGTYHPVSQQYEVMLVDAAAPVDQGVARSRFEDLTSDLLADPAQGEATPLLRLAARWPFMSEDPAAQAFFEGLELYRRQEWLSAVPKFKASIESARESIFAMIAWHLLARVKAETSGGRWAGCDPELQESLRLHRLHGKKLGEFQVLTSLGRCYTDMKAYQPALDALEASKRLGESLGIFVQHDATLVNSLAALLNASGDYESAIELLKPAIRSFRSLHDLRNVAISSHLLGRAYVIRGRTGDRERAVELYEESMNLGKSAKLNKHVGIVENSYARLLMDRRQPADLAKAASLLADAQGRHQAIGYEYGLRMTARTQEELESYPCPPTDALEAE